MVCLLVSISQCTHLYIMSNDHSPGSVHYSLININCCSKVILLLKLQILSDPDRIPLMYVSVMYADYRSAFLQHLMPPPDSSFPPFKNSASVCIGAFNPSGMNFTCIELMSNGVEKTAMSRYILENAHWWQGHMVIPKACEQAAQYSSGPWLSAVPHGTAETVPTNSIHPGLLHLPSAVPCIPA